MSKVASAGIPYFEHYVKDLRARREEHKRLYGDDASLMDFKAWHEAKYGFGALFADWMEHEAPRFRNDAQ